MFNHGSKSLEYSLMGREGAVWRAAPSAFSLLGLIPPYFHTPQASRRHDKPTLLLAGWLVVGLNRLKPATVRRCSARKGVPRSHFRKVGQLPAAGEASPSRSARQAAIRGSFNHCRLITLSRSSVSYTGTLFISNNEEEPRGLQGQGVLD